MHDPFEALGAHPGVPADVLIAILERIDAGTPDQQRHGLAIEVGPLPEHVPHGRTAPDVVLLFHQPVEFFLLGGVVHGMDNDAGNRGARRGGRNFRGK